MRVVNPEHTSKELARRRRAAKRRRRLLWSLFTIIAIVAVSAWVIMLRDSSKNSEVVNSQPATDTAQQQVVEEEKPPVIKTFTGDEFKALYSSFSYPFTEQIESPPPISGDPAADKRIQDLAESRGYALRSSPIANQLANVSEEFQIQQLAAEPLNKLLTQLNNQGLPLSITSAYRSIEDQTTIFVDRLAERGVSIESTSYIAEGLADEIIIDLLATTAPPGYSRHHTGYTVDFQCGAQGLSEFAASPCYAAMSADNYKVMKELGFIPSYPEGTSLQGPEPESWEYIWVGVEALYE